MTSLAGSWDKALVLSALLSMGSLLAPFTASAQLVGPTMDVSVPKRQASPAPFVQTPPAETHGVVTVHGVRIPYRTVIAEAPYRTISGAVIATSVTFAYLEAGGDPAKRPVLFLMGGGPGGAVNGLIKGLAPRPLFPVRRPDGSLDFPDNPETLLDATDLVFVDSVSNGYSRLLDEKAVGEVLGVRPDSHALTDFIAGWLTANHRQSSPIFLLGESYGGIRSAMVAKYLAAKNIAVDGVIQISPSTDVIREHESDGPPDPRRENPMESTAMALPAMAAIARYYGKGDFTKTSLEDTAAQAAAFAMGPYFEAVHDPNLTPKTKQHVALELSRYVGMTPSFLLSQDLKLSIPSFRDTLLADRGLKIGASDGRQNDLRVLRDLLPPPYSDPSMVLDDDVLADRLMTQEYGFRPPEHFMRFSGFAATHWTWDMDDEETFMPAVLAQLMKSNPRMNVLVEGGLYDLRVPWMDSKGAFDRQGLPAGRFRYQIFASGHAVYEDPQSRPASTELIRSFIRHSAQ